MLRFSRDLALQVLSSTCCDVSQYSICIKIYTVIRKDVFHSLRLGSVFNQQRENFLVTRMRLQRYSGLACLEIRLRNEEASPRFHGLCKQRLSQCPAFCVLNYNQKFWGYIQKNWEGVCSFLKTLPNFRPKSVISLPYLRPDNKFDILFQT